MTPITRRAGALLAGLLLAALPAATVRAAAGGFAKGADISWITEMEAAGRPFLNRDGKRQDLFVTLREQGMDAVRLRVWVDPADGYNGLADVLAKARRARDAGMRLMIDFHYSDNWADPAKQFKPAAWKGYSVERLAGAVAEHTRATLAALREAGITPEWVQVGNETTHGVLWPEGAAGIHMANYARFVASGYDAVKQIFPDALVIVHVDNCHDNRQFRWNFDGLLANGGKFDVIGASAYPTTVKRIGWRAATAACLHNMNDLAARYGKPVMLAEVGVPWNHPEGKAIVADLIAKVRQVDHGKGVGAFYWEPQAYDWKGYPMGAFDRGGKPTAIMDAFVP
ncbi:MAG TPA: glycosyl hydrolase 53 family protein [Duganella sp.]|uniref:glycoside hydrolase family 53 protein n=1 Tax=Duganella sp. TaxID=1904440 RepID=UPI002ED1F3D5